ncbi:MAG: TIGR00730 family Rossman fold protein [Lachnospiraceae bacterium]|jgi:uncharacterized protein (TIGR00730 family)
MRIVVYCGSNPSIKPDYFQEARRVGEWIAANGYELVYGGGKAGLMGAVADAVIDGGGVVTGVIPRFMVDKQLLRPGLTNVFVTPDMATRRLKMIELGDFFLALPGGVGTLEEISEMMSRTRLGLSREPVALLNTTGFYNPLKEMIRKMTDEGFLWPEEKDQIHFIEKPEELEALVSTVSGTGHSV